MNRRTFPLTCIALSISALHFLGFAEARAEISEEAQSLITSMSEKLAAADVLRVSGTRTIDPALLGEGAAKQSAEVSLLLARPARFLAESKDDQSTRRLLFNGKTATLVDRSEVGLYFARAEVEANSFDDLADLMLARFGYVPPMAEFFAADPKTLLLQDVDKGEVAGKEEVAGTNCHHLAFSQEGLAWDLWIGIEDHLPRRFVMRYTEIAGTPAIEAELAEWKLAEKVEDSLFIFEPGEDAKEVQIVTSGEVESTETK